VFQKGNVVNRKKKGEKKMEPSRDEKGQSKKKKKGGEREKGQWNTPRRPDVMGCKGKKKKLAPRERKNM